MRMLVTFVILRSFHSSHIKEPTLTTGGLGYVLEAVLSVKLDTTYLTMFRCCSCDVLFYDRLSSLTALRTELSICFYLSCCEIRGAR